jgi:hypothetical protein
MTVFDTWRGACESAGMKTALMTAVVAAFACGGGPRPDSTGPLETARNNQQHDTRGHHAGDMDRASRAGSGEAGEMAAMPPSVAKFHATLAPYWHAKQGPQRMTDTCAAMDEFRAGADAIVAAPPPEHGEAAAWSAGGKQLADAVTALAGTCKDSDAAGFETALTQVHERFHGLMAAATGEQDHDDHARDPERERDDHAHAP